MAEQLSSVFGEYFYVGAVLVGLIVIAAIWVGLTVVYRCRGFAAGNAMMTIYVAILFLLLFFGVFDPISDWSLVTSNIPELPLGGLN